MIFFSLPMAAVALVGQTRTGAVLSIGDGDTLRVREGNSTLSVRLACIDAPESSQAPFADQARQQLQALAPVGSSVELGIKATDRYGRSVAELTRGGRNLNQALVASGVAFVYLRYTPDCDRQTYRSKNGGQAEEAWRVECQQRADVSVGIPLRPTQTELELERTSLSIKQSWNSASDN